MTPPPRRLLALFLIPLFAACASEGFTPDDALGEWEKLGDSLPPINWFYPEMAPDCRLAFAFRALN